MSGWESWLNPLVLKTSVATRSPVVRIHYQTLCHSITTVVGSPCKRDVAGSIPVCGSLSRLMCGSWFLSATQRTINPLKRSSGYGGRLERRVSCPAVLCCRISIVEGSLRKRKVESANLSDSSIEETAVDEQREGSPNSQIGSLP